MTVSIQGGTKIEWTDFTFSPWHGCEKVSPGCAHCYAEGITRRYDGPGLWGPGHGFKFQSDAYWRKPLAWARTAPAKLGRRPRVFCASMADVFEERQEIGQARERLFALIAATPELDWLVLTKRPEYARMVLGHPQFWLGVASEMLRLCVPVLPGDFGEWARGARVMPNVWMGVSIENARHTWRADVLRQIPAAVRFISAEPLLGSLYERTSDAKALDSVRPLVHAADHGQGDRQEIARLGGRRAAVARRAPLSLDGIDWVIIGGESGPGARPLHVTHAREILEAVDEQRIVHDHEVAIFVKQLGANPLDGTGYPLALTDRKGGAIDEWPHDLRIREFPRSAA